MKPQLLPIAATVTTTLALLSITPLPILGTSNDIRNLAIGASVTLWLTWRADRNHQRACQTIADIDAVRAQVEEIRQHTHIEQLLEKAGAGSTFTLPTPRGDVRAVPTDIDGETVLVGVDNSAHLANVIDLRHALSGGDDRAAQ